MTLKIKGNNEMYKIVYTPTNEILFTDKERWWAKAYVANHIDVVMVKQ